MWLRLLCRIFGHDFIFVGAHRQRCRWCDGWRTCTRVEPGRGFTFVPHRGEPLTYDEE